MLYLNVPTHITHGCSILLCTMFTLKTRHLGTNAILDASVIHHPVLIIIIFIATLIRTAMVLKIIILYLLTWQYAGTHAHGMLLSNSVISCSVHSCGL